MKVAYVAKWAPLAFACLLFIAHSLMFRTYIVDDAAISFSYSRNLAHGYGLVAQPGVPPVEGYSNFTWVMLMAVPMALHAFDMHLTPKLLSILCILLCFYTYYRALTLSKLTSNFVAGLALVLLSLNTSFVVYTTAGLEGPLYALLLSLLFYCIARVLVSGVLSRSGGLLVGVLAALIAMTRPDGLVFAAAYPLALLYKGRDLARAERRKQLLISLASYLLSFGLLFAAFIAFRLAYFGEVVPNTYFAKVGVTAGDLANPISRLSVLSNKALAVFSGVENVPGAAILVFTLLVTAYLVARRRFTPSHYLLGVLSLSGALIFALLPTDIMFGYRFALPFFLFIYGYLATTMEAAMASLPALPSYRRLAGVFSAGTAICWGVLAFLPESTSASASPWVPVDVVRPSVVRFDRYASQLGLPAASMLVPDVGGGLYYSRLRIYDLGMLTDKSIAKTLNKDQPAFYNYVFDDAKPTFIQTHDQWTLYARLDADPRFRRDYATLREWTQTYPSASGPVTLFSGDYVRKDALVGKESVVEQLKTEANTDMPTSQTSR